MSHRSSKYGIKDKRSKPEVAKGEIRTQRREERELEEGRGAIIELERRIADAQKAVEQAPMAVGVVSEQVRKVTLELAEERRKVARLQVDLLDKRAKMDQAAICLTDVQEAPARLQKALESTQSAIDAVSSSIEQRKTVLQQLIEAQKDELVSLGMSEQAKRLTSDQESLPLEAFQSSLEALLSKLSLAWTLNGGGEPTLPLSPSLLEDLSGLFPSNDDSLSSVLGVTRAAFGLSVPASAQLSTSGYDASTTDTKPPLVVKTGGQYDSETDMLARAQQQLVEEQCRAATAQARLLAVEEESRSPLSSSASEPRRQSQDLISLLHKTSQDLNRTIKQLRDEQSELLQRLGTEERLA